MVRKKCSKCRKTLPATKEYFHSNPSQKKGLSNYCKECAREYARNYKKKKREANKRNSKSFDRFGIGKEYQVLQGNMQRKGHSNFNFKGEVIYEDLRLLILKSDKKVREAFLKNDFKTGDYKIKEMI